MGGAPLGHVGGGLELHTLHIGTAECRSDDGDEEPDVGEQRGYLSQAEVQDLSYRNEPHDAGKAGVDKYEGPEGQHSCETNGVNGSLVGGYLTGEPHGYGEYSCVDECGDSRLDSEEVGEEADPMT